MEEHQSPDNTDARRAQLLAAAEVLVDWVHARRATWSSLPLPQITAAPPTLAIEDSIAYDAWVVDDPAPPKVKPARPAVRLPITARALHSLAAPLVRWSLRAGALAAVLAIVVAAGWFARPYWLKLTAPKHGTAVLESVPPGSEVRVDGTVVGTAPLTTELAPGHHVVEFRQRNEARKLVIDVAAGRSTVGHLDWSAQQISRLVVHSEPAGARVLIDGRPRGVTPLTLDDLSVGSHAVVLQSDQGSVRRTITVTSDRAAQVNESIYPGWLRVFAPFELEITEGARGIRLDEQNQVLLSPGTHDLRLENRALGYRETRRVEVEPGQTTSLSLVPPPSTLTVTATVPAEVLIDGEHVGDTPLTNQSVALGTRDIVVRSTEGQERLFTMTVTVMPVRIDVDFSQP